MKPRSDLRPALLFLLPNLLGFLLFTLWPVVASALLSFTEWDLLSPPRWVGLRNFQRLLGFQSSPEGWKAMDPQFWQYTYNTLFMMLALPFTMAGSLILALALNKKIRFAWTYRLVFFLPSILAGVAIFYLWRWIYNPDYGLFNRILATVGITGPKWLTEIAWSKPALMIMGFWLSVGGQSMLLYLAALQGISPELYEAASIDGANRWHSFWAITWPAVAPVTFFIFVMAFIGGLQGGFESAFIMTGGGPSGSTTTIGYYIYTNAYVFFKMGYAAAIAWILFLLVLGITVINWRFGGRHIAS